MALDPPCVIAPPEVEIGDRARHHIAVRLLPFLFVLYIANYLDRTNLAYAALGMSRDLGFSDRVIGLGVGIVPMDFPNAFGMAETHIAPGRPDYIDIRLEGHLRRKGTGSWRPREGSGQERSPRSATARLG